MKTNIKLPRRTWRFNPATRVKKSAKGYARAQPNQATRRKIHE
ncbi:MAG TPA: hypothetical protein QGH16_06585 [Verrucomicrobiota bacterium]|nr:hypothetical protein [Verrucomicrobiota bacterium]